MWDEKKSSQRDTYLLGGERGNLQEKKGNGCLPFKNIREFIIKRSLGRDCPGP